MTKIEECMKEIIVENSTHCMEGAWFTELASGSITVRKNELVFGETGYEKRGDIFSKIGFSEFFLQMFPARFDMILRVCGSFLVRQLNRLSINRESIVISVQYGVGVKDDLPVSCPVINLKSYGREKVEDELEDVVKELSEIIAENLGLLTDTFLRELKNIVEKGEKNGNMGIVQ